MYNFLAISSPFLALRVEYNGVDRVPPRAKALARDQVEFGLSCEMAARGSRQSVFKNAVIFGGEKWRNSFPVNDQKQCTNKRSF